MRQYYALFEIYLKVAHVDPPRYVLFEDGTRRRIDIDLDERTVVLTTP